MSHKWLSSSFCWLLVAVRAEQVSGTYLETRTCQVYTGPCFANAETGMAGREAVMAWNIEAGKKGNVDLAGLSGRHGSAGERHAGPPGDRRRQRDPLDDHRR